MAYLGTTPNTGENRKLDDISGSFNGSTTTFDLQVDSSDIYPGAATALLISVGGVLQEPKTAYTLASNGKQITFATAPSTSEDFFGVVLGQAIDVATPADDSVTTAKIADNAVTAIKLADPLGFANVAGNVSIGRSLAVGYTDGRVPQANLDVKGNVFISGVTTGATFEPTGDTSTSDAAAIGYTVAEGLILTGQGSTGDVTIKNDADTTVAYVPTGTDDLLFPDDAKLLIGTGGDLQIYHDGSNSYLAKDVGTGALISWASANYIRRLISCIASLLFRSVFSSLCGSSR